MLCNDGAISNEMHAFMDCSHTENNQFRSELNNTIMIYNESIFKKTKLQTFIDLLSSTDGFIAYSVGKFIIILFYYE